MCGSDMCLVAALAVSLAGIAFGAVLVGLGRSMGRRRPDGKGPVAIGGWWMFLARSTSAAAA